MMAPRLALLVPPLLLLLLEPAAVRADVSPFAWDTVLDMSYSFCCECDPCVAFRRPTDRLRCSRAADVPLLTAADRC